MFSRDFGRPKRAKVNIYLGFVAFGASVVALLLWRWWCPLGAGGQGFEGLRLSPGVFRAFLPAFCPLCRLCLWCVACKYGLISRFKGVFSAVWAFGVGLYCLRALRGLWGFCTRV